jgi:hypothetical protein
VARIGCVPWRNKFSQQLSWVSDGNFMEYGKGNIEKIIKLAKKMDNLQSKIDIDSYSSRKKQYFIKTSEAFDKWRTKQYLERSFI